MKKITIILALMLVGTNALAGNPPAGPGLGTPVNKDEIAKWDMSVMPDGTGLPPGKGSVDEGKLIYDKYCLSCHGEGAVGNSGDQLAGAQMSLTSEYPEKTIGTYWPWAPTLFDFIRRSMPMTKPGVLSDNEAYAVTAYLLNLNGIIKPADVMNAKNLAKIKMPNRNGFINIYETEKSHN